MNYFRPTKDYYHTPADSTWFRSRRDYLSFVNHTYWVETCIAWEEM
jgi:hypothetical protein